MPPLIEIALFAFLIVTALGIAWLRHLFAVVMLAGVFSLLSALLLLSMDAADVAFTEAAVGAGIATILMLGAMALTERREKLPARPWLARLPSLLLACALGGLLLYAMTDAPPFGDPLAPAQQHLAPYYIAATKGEIGVPNLVTAILASYRGFDTLGEVVVIFTAGVGVAMLLAAGRAGSTAPTGTSPSQNTPTSAGGREGVLGKEKAAVERASPHPPRFASRKGGASFGTPSHEVAVQKDRLAGAPPARSCTNVGWAGKNMGGTALRRESALRFRVTECRKKNVGGLPPHEKHLPNAGRGSAEGRGGLAPHKRSPVMQHHLVLRITAKILFAPILLFALYVQFHGDYGPGGGFQAGLIFASALILHGLLFDIAATRRFLSDATLASGAALGVLLYAGTGAASLLLGGNYLDYDLLLPSPVAGQHLGIILVEAGVGLTVASVVVLIFRAFADRLPCIGEEEW